MSGEVIDINDAIVIYLKHYPGKNDAEFDSHFGPNAAANARSQVRQILDEAMKVKPDWNSMSLNEAGDFVESVMHERHPELSAKSLECIGNYYTYLMR